MTVDMARMHDAIGPPTSARDRPNSEHGGNCAISVAVGGDLGFSESLDQLATDAQALETDPDHLAFFARSQNLFVPGTLEQSIWQILL
jgi:hypothetical protein